MIKRTLLFVFAAMQIHCTAQNILKQIIKTDSFYTKYKDVFLHPEKYHLQIIYTQINRDKDNVPHLKKYFLEPPSKNYFYPASLVKLPFSALALEKIDRLNISDLTKDSRLLIDSLHRCQTKEYVDTTAESGYPSIAQYLKKMLLVSNNKACNRIYEFLSPDYINKRLHEMGYQNILINQRLGGGCDTNDNRFTNPFVFLRNDSSVIYKQAADTDNAAIANCALCTKIGRGFKEDGRIRPPRNFCDNNYIPFEDENNILLSIIFPECINPSLQFHITESDYQFLYKYMSMLPRESDYPHYDEKVYKDNFKKYIYFGTTDSIKDSTVRSFNIVGRAYGFLADCAYIVDPDTHTEFCLSVLIYANEKNILNTGKYQYDSLALPFMADLGHLIFNYEQKRTKKHIAYLNAWRFHYP
ncbi:MAG: serine hydrolase [Bacteroidia bacterium]